MKKFNVLLIVVTLAFLNGCAHFQANPTFNTPKQMINGEKPTGGRYHVRNVHDYLDIQERNNALEFEKKLTNSKLINSTTQIPGLPGKIRNHSRHKTITFLVEGQATTKNFTLYPGEVIDAGLPTGKYRCHFLSGSRELCRPHEFSADNKVDYFYGEWVLWGLVYSDY